MWLQVALLTVSALFAAISVWSALRAGRASDACQHSEARLLTQRGRIVGLEGALENLHAQHRKLAGRVYADEHWDKQREQQSVAETGLLIGNVCENWHKAQLDGPTSPAAQCVCDFCEGMRAQRAAARAQLLPKGATVAALRAKQ